MKALTLKQPWASAVVFGTKRVENRNWKPPQEMIGQRIAIHAGKSWDDDGFVFCQKNGLFIVRELCRFGFIIGTAVIEKVIEGVDELDEEQKKWFEGPFGWVFKDVHSISPVEIRGKLKLWEWK